jgi:hypothetical protein
MSWLFSKRCRQALNNKETEVHIPLNVRVRIWKLFEKYDQLFEETTDTGYIYNVTTLELLPDKIISEIGCKNLIAFPEGEGKAEPSDLRGFILRGIYPPYLFDALELFYETIEEGNEFQYQRELNDIMEESNLSWRMANGKIFPVNSAYIDEEIIRRSYRLINAVKYHGALQEFEKARIDLVNGDYEGAIQNAYLALESVMKEILNVKKARQGELFRMLIKSDLIPEYHIGFLKAFEKDILRCVAVMRNEELGVGHGRGSSKSTVPPELAEFAINLSSVLMNFLIKLQLKQVKVNEEKELHTEDDDIPF